MAITANEPPRTLDAAQIAQILPHRYPIKSPTIPPASGPAASSASP